MRPAHWDRGVRNANADGVQNGVRSADPDSALGFARRPSAFRSSESPIVHVALRTIAVMTDDQPPSSSTRSSRVGRAARGAGAGDRRRRRPARRRRGVGVRLGRAPGARHRIVADQRAGHARARVRRDDRARSAATVRGFREGDRVVSETAAVICGACGMCRSGRYNLCPTRKGFGYGVNGAMARVRARCRRAASTTCPTRCRSISRAWPSRTPSPTTRCA